MKYSSNLFITNSIHGYMNPQPRPDNITVAAITIMTISRWVLTSRSHSNAQTNTKYRTKVTEYGARSIVRGSPWRVAVRLVESSVEECAQPSVLRRIDLWVAKGPSIYTPSGYDATYWVVGQSLGFPNPPCPPYWISTIHLRSPGLSCNGGRCNPVGRTHHLGRLIHPADAT